MTEQEAKDYATQNNEAEVSFGHITGHIIGYGKEGPHSAVPNRWGVLVRWWSGAPLPWYKLFQWQKGLAFTDILSSHAQASDRAYWIADPNKALILSRGPSLSAASKSSGPAPSLVAPIPPGDTIKVTLLKSGSSGSPKCDAQIYAETNLGRRVRINWSMCENSCGTVVGYNFKGNLVMVVVDQIQGMEGIPGQVILLPNSKTRPGQFFIRTLTLLAETPPKTEISHYPHSCKACKAPAYVSIVSGRVDCSSQTCCHYGTK